jgi:hypothetical protein
MIDFLVVVFFGWPAILATVILMLIGLFRSDYRFLVAAAVLAVPFSWFLSGFPVMRSFIFLLPLLPFSSAFLMNRGREMFAWVISVPYFLFIWLLFNVIKSG